MFFKKHKSKDMEALVNEARALSQSGMPDKDIIKKLKSEGYSYSDIEKAMLEAVKQGVMPSNIPQLPSQMNRELRPVFQKSEEETPTEFSTEELPETEIFEPSQTDSVEEVVEEVIESFVNEKWQKAEGKLKNIENDLNNIKVQLKNLDNKINSAKTEKTNLPIDEINEQIEDLQARVGGLEKAFKQFLPSLTANIENLSNMIHEMKNKEQKY